MCCGRCAQCKCRKVGETPVSGPHPDPDPRSESAVSGEPSVPGQGVGLLAVPS